MKKNFIITITIIFIFYIFFIENFKSQYIENPEIILNNKTFIIRKKKILITEIQVPGIALNITMPIRIGNLCTYVNDINIAHNLFIFYEKIEKEKLFEKFFCYINNIKKNLKHENYINSCILENFKINVFPNIFKKYDNIIFFEEKNKYKINIYINNILLFENNVNSECFLLYEEFINLIYDK